MESWREELYANSLMHYGIKGMKWGKHRSQSFLNALNEAGQATDRVNEARRALSAHTANRGKYYNRIAEAGGVNYRSDHNIRLSRQDGPRPYAQANGAKSIMGLWSGDKKDIYNARVHAAQKTLGQFRKKQTEAQSKLRKEVINERLRDQSRRDKEDNTYTTTEEQRKKYKRSRAKNKISKIAKKYGINIKQYSSGKTKNKIKNAGKKFSSGIKRSIGLH